MIPAFVIAQSDEKNDSSIASADSSKHKRYSLTLAPSIGAGLYRNELAPSFYIGIGIKKRNFYEVNFNSSSIFFFERDIDRNYEIFRNTFINAEFLLNLSFFGIGELNNWNGLGFGYLVESKGQYFRETTFQLYYRKKMRYFSIVPGLILSDNLKEVFPIISIRL